MDEVKQVTLIRTTNKRAGDGRDDPIRIIEQYWNLDGSLLFEYDTHTKQASYYPHIPLPVTCGVIQTPRKYA